MEKVIYNYLIDRPLQLPEMEISRTNKIRVTFKGGIWKELYPNGLLGYYRPISSPELRIGISVTNYSMVLYNIDKRRDREILEKYSAQGFDVLDVERITEIIPPGNELAMHYWISENNQKNFFDRKSLTIW